MTYLEENTLAGLIKAVAEINSQLLNLVKELQVGDWLTTEEASAKTGLSARQLRYGAETGKWKSQRQGHRYFYFGPDLRAYNTQTARSGDKNNRITQSGG